MAILGVLALTSDMACFILVFVGALRIGESAADATVVFWLAVPALEALGLVLLVRRRADQLNTSRNGSLTRLATIAWVLAAIDFVILVATGWPFAVLRLFFAGQLEL